MNANLKHIMEILICDDEDPYFQSQIGWIENLTYSSADGSKMVLELL